MAAEAYSVAGSYTWVCPQGVTSVTVLCVGAGAGGADGSGTPGGPGTGGGGGGGGGESAASVVSVTPGTGYALVVGAGGTPNGSPGNTSFGGSTVVANGGGLAANGVGAAGGAGGTGGTGTTLLDGGAGGNADGGAGPQYGGGGGGGGADDAGAGNAGAAGSFGNGGAGALGGSGATVTGGAGGNGGGQGGPGAAGVWPGGGGGGGSAGGQGGTGADGAVIIVYSDPAFATATLVMAPDIGTGGPRDCQSFGRWVNAVLNSLGRQGVLTMTGAGPDYGLYFGGTAGQVLTSNGPGSQPTYQAAAGGLTQAQACAIASLRA